MAIPNVNWGSVADWALAVGSVLASGVALYLSADTNRLKATVDCSVKVQVDGVTTTKVVSILVTNTGGIDFQPDIRKVFYTTNTIESVNMSLRKITKNRGSFPSDKALLKLFYLALRNISKKWTMPIRGCKAALTRFTISYEGRLPQQ